MTTNGELYSYCLNVMVKNRFTKEQEAKVLLSGLGLKTSLSKTP